MITADRQPYATLLLGWDAEARAEGRRQAQEMMGRDPIAAQMLLDQIQAEAEKEVIQEEKPMIVDGTQEPYDPMRLYAKMGRIYNWMSDEVIDRMHYVKFAGYIRETTLDHEEEERQRKSGGSGGSNIYAENSDQAEMQLGQFVSRPRLYTGAVVPYTLS